MLGPLALIFLMPLVVKWYYPLPVKGREVKPIIRVRTKYDHMRTIILSLAFFFYMYSAIAPPQNIFLSLASSPSTSTFSRLLPILRKPLNIRTPTEKLAQRWATQTRKELSPDNLYLLSRLQNLDARLAYVAHGENPLLHCEWCRSPSSGNYSLDYFFYNLPFLSLSYLILLIILGSATFGDWNYWRALLVSGSCVGFSGEILVRLWIASMGGSVNMVRFFLFFHFYS